MTSKGAALVADKRDSQSGSKAGAAPGYPTASSLDRAAKCLASCMLPQAEGSPSEGRERGRAIAAYLEDAANTTPEEALSRVPEEYRSLCMGLPVEHRQHLAAEVAFAYDPRTGQARELGRGIGRDYVGAGALPHEMVGTIDLLGVSDDAVLVADDKGFQEVPHASENLQLGFAALCAAKVYGKSQALVKISRPLGGQHRPTEAELDDFGLAEVEAELQRIAAAVDTGIIPDPVPGKHCRYCKAQGCPVAEAPIQALEVRQVIDPMAPVTRENAADWYHGLQAVKNWLDQKLGAVYALASEGPIDLGNGSFLGQIEKPGKETLDPVIAYGVLLELVGEEAANAATPRTVTKTAIKEALRVHVGRGFSKVEAQAIKEIRAAGGSRRGVTRKVEEYRGAPPKLRE